jgi:uncharacterized protein DUF4112
MPYTRYAYPGYGSFDAFRSRRERIARVDALATLLDTAFVLPGTNVRFGLDGLLGLVPGIGDLVTTLMSLYIVLEARELGAPGHIIVRMIGNVALDGIVGAVPVVGDIFDVLWRANRRNMRLLQDWLAHELQGDASRRGWQPVNRLMACLLCGALADRNRLGSRSSSGPNARPSPAAWDRTARRRIVR